MVDLVAKDKKQPTTQRGKFTEAARKLGVAEMDEAAFDRVLKRAAKPMKRKSGSEKKPDK
ncbi:MAG: hypothetical protein U1E49_01450 [Hyphomicrobiaceae bacterium]